MKANANHFFKAFEHCLKCKMNVKQAIIMGKGFSKRGLVDASEGCIHFAMRLIVKTAEGDNKNSPNHGNRGISNGYNNSLAYLSEYLGGREMKTIQLKTTGNTVGVNDDVAS